MHRVTLNISLMGLAFSAFLSGAVRTDYDHKADFGRYHTYSWVGVKAGDSASQDRVMQAVDSALAAKGWQRVPSGGDAAVAATESVSADYTVDTFLETPLSGYHWQEEWVQTTGATPGAGTPQMVGWSANIGVEKEMVMVPNRAADLNSATVTNDQGAPISRDSLQARADTPTASPDSIVTQTVPVTVRAVVLEIMDGRDA